MSNIVSASPPLMGRTCVHARQVRNTCVRARARPSSKREMGYQNLLEDWLLLLLSGAMSDSWPSPSCCVENQLRLSPEFKFRRVGTAKRGGEGWNTQRSEPTLVQSDRNCCSGRRTVFLCGESVHCRTSPLYRERKIIQYTRAKFWRDSFSCD